VVMPLSAVFTRQCTGITEVKSGSGHWPCLFPQHDPGMKNARKSWGCAVLRLTASAWSGASRGRT
jgi:hypothetical protein